jgi:glycosyltransferase involved in cell wall biosynthesis
MDQIAESTDEVVNAAGLAISSPTEHGQESAAGEKDLAPSKGSRFVRKRWPQAPAKVHISLVIPAMNEERNIGWVLERLPAEIDEVILVDGNSVDETVAVSRAICPDIRVVGQDRPGKGAALRAGFAAARGDIIVMIDADRSMDPIEIKRFLALIEEGYDLVKGSRFMGDGGTTDMERVRRYGNAALRGIANSLYGTRFSDLCYGFMAFRRDALPKLALAADGFEIETEIVTRSLRAGLHVGEVGSFERDRMNGVSHLVAMRDGPRVLRTLLVNRFRTRTIDLDYAATSVPLTTSCEAVQP